MSNERDRDTEVAFALLQLFPPKVSKSLAEEDHFRKRFGLTLDARIRLGQLDAEFTRSVLLAAVRQVLAGAVASAQIESKDGTMWQVSPRENGIAVGREGATAVLPELACLSPDVRVRKGWFEGEISRFSIVDDAISKWELILSARPVEDEELDALLDDFRLMPTHVAASIGERLRRGKFTPSDLVPSSLRYFHRLVGTPTEDADLQVFMSTVAASHVRQLIARNSFEGLSAALLLSSHHLAPEVIDLQAIPKEVVVRVYEWLADAGDSVSTVGAIECGLRHLDVLPDLEPSLIAMTRALADEDPKASDGRLRLLSGLVALVEGELARRGLARKQRPFWRRLASIAHASLIERELVAANVELAGISKWALQGGGALYYMQTLIDVRQEPRWFPDSISPQQLKAEFVSRIANAAGRHREKVREGQLSSILWGDAPTTIESQRRFPSGYLPGPLEGGTEAVLEMPTELEASIRSSLEAEELSPESFFGLVNSSLIFRIGSQLSELAAQGLRRVGYQLRKGNANIVPFGILNGLAMVSAVTRSVSLADEVRILARAVRRRDLKKLSPDEIVRIAVVAAAANKEAASWASFLGDWLNELALTEMTYDEAVGLQGDLYHLLHLDPVLWETCSRAEAALAAFVESFPKNGSNPQSATPAA